MIGGHDGIMNGRVEGFIDTYRGGVDVVTINLAHIIYFFPYTTIDDGKRHTRILLIDGSLIEVDDDYDTIRYKMGGV